MREVYIAGIGQTAVGEHWDRSLRELALEAAELAVQDAGAGMPQALFVGNMLAPLLSGQANLGSLLADYCGWRGIEASTIEAAGASGAAALRQGYLAVSSGLVDTALVLGVEKMTDKIGAGVSAALASAHDADYEAAQGVTPVAVAALLMRRYMHEHGAGLPDFAGFSVNAHANAGANPYAMYRNPLTVETYLSAGMLADPVNMFDSAPEADGAAAVLLTASGEAARGQRRPAVRLAASAVATDSLAVHDRRDPLALSAAALSSRKAYDLAGLKPEQIQLVELHDSFGIFAVLSLEASGFAQAGHGWRLADPANPAIALGGRLPISTFGGLKARGNPGGATGVYQAVEVTLQLRGEAGANQVGGTNGNRPRRGMAQSLGGSGAVAVTHVFQSL
jgi:acetyl-CoA C-acetyltransferase